MPLIEHGPDRIEAVEMVPFRAAIEADVAAIMTAHILIPAYDGERPATLSPAIVDTLLKKRLGYGGLVLSDDLEMKAKQPVVAVAARAKRIAIALYS